MKFFAVASCFFYTAQMCIAALEDSFLTFKEYGTEEPFRVELDTIDSLGELKYMLNVPDDLAVTGTTSNSNTKVYDCDTRSPIVSPTVIVMESLVDPNTAPEGKDIEVKLFFTKESPQLYSSDGTTATYNFCARTEYGTVEIEDIESDGSNEVPGGAMRNLETSSIAFLDVKLVISFGLVGNAEIQLGLGEPIEIEKAVTKEFDYEMKACICDNESECVVSPTVTEGSVFNVCVTSDNGAFKIDKVDEVTVSNDNVEYFVVKEAAAVEGIAEMSFNAVEKAWIIRTIPITALIHSGKDEATCKVKAQFETTPRVGGAKRAMAEEGSTSTSIEDTSATAAFRFKVLPAKSSFNGSAPESSGASLGMGGNHVASVVMATIVMTGIAVFQGLGVREQNT